MSNKRYYLFLLGIFALFLLPIFFIILLVQSAPNGALFLWFEDFEDSTHLESFLLLIPWGIAAALLGNVQAKRDFGR